MGLSRTATSSGETGSQNIPLLYGYSGIHYAISSRVAGVHNNTTHASFASIAFLGARTEPTNLYVVMRKYESVDHKLGYRQIQVCDQQLYPFIPPS